MTLLERLRRHVPDDNGVFCVYMTKQDMEKCRRAIAIAQAVEEWPLTLDGPRAKALRRADELLRGEK